jgi:nucleotide-binding universal stress UspA family protein
MYRKMLIANDGSPGGEKALAGALELARRLEVGLAMICVEELPRFPASIGEITEAQADAENVFEKVVASAAKLARAQGIAFESHIVAGHPVPSIVEFVHRGGYDLLIVGYMGHSALYNRVIGSTTHRLVELAPCKVMIVK